MARRLYLLIALTAAFAVAWLVLTGPAAKPADAPPAQFSGGRAMADVAVIAARPHPVGSAEDAQVRDHLVRRMTELGLAPRVQSTVQVSDKTHLPVRVDNVIGLLPGTDPASPAVTVMAHYDSTPHGPGAADDAAGAAAVLETARALKSQGQSARDVAFVITDGEEAGMLGAKAFFAGDPLARRTGFVVNMEARGSRGRAMMFETGRHNGETIALFRASAHRPVSNSLMVMVYEQMPNFTDFTEAKKAGLQGVNFAFLGGPRDYHAAADTPANLDQRSLQDLGQQVLAITRTAANANRLPRAAPNRVYSDILNLHILAYPAWVGWLIVVGAAVLAALGIIECGVTGRDVAAGVGVSLGLLIVSGALFWLWQLGAQAIGLKASHDQVLISAVAWAIAVAILAGWEWISRRHRAGHWAGALIVAMILVALAQTFAAPAAPILAWPVAVACLSAAITALGARFALTAAALAIPAVAFVTVLSHLAGLALLTPLAMTLWPWAAALALAPLARPVNYRPA